MVCFRLHRILVDLDYIYPFQIGFRKKFFRYDCLIRIERNIRKSFLRNEYTLAVFLDIEKHMISVTMGLRVSSFVYKNFLTNFTIKVMIGNNLSEKFAMECGVPRKSTTSPILFTIMLNDLYANIYNMQSLPCT